jgi:hypothetical protein
MGWTYYQFFGMGVERVPVIYSPFSNDGSRYLTISLHLIVISCFDFLKHF